MIFEHKVLGSLVLIRDDVTSAMAVYSLPSESGREAGGILLGSYRGPHVDVVACTGPIALDRRGVFFFDRQDPGHQEIAMRYWQCSGGRVTCVGEWHTHPADEAIPSRVDRATWRDQVQTADAPRVYVIVGRKAIWCGVGLRFHAVSEAQRISDPET